MKNLQELESEKKDLIAQFRTDKEIDPRQALDKIRAIDKRMESLRIAEMLNRVNREQSAKRKDAAIVWDCEQPTEDITTNDGSLHKVKAKKYPKLSAIPRVRINYKNGVALEINIGREKFTMYKTKYESGKPDEYTRPETFAEFLELNGIQPEDISAEQFVEFSNKLNQANEELKQAIEKYSLQCKEINRHQMQVIGLVSQRTEHVYSYEAKKGY